MFFATISAAQRVQKNILKKLWLPRPGVNDTADATVIRKLWLPRPVSMISQMLQ